jgi:hypothetical protein
MRAKELSMFRIQLAQRQPLRQSTQRSREPAGRGRFRNSQDFSVRAYQRLDAIHSRVFLPAAVRALGRIAGGFMRHVLDAMYDSRREEALRVLGRYDHLVGAKSQARLPISQRPAGAREDSQTGGFESQAVYGMRIRCSITGSPCEGDRAHLCVEWGCARKGGLSPMSHENA